MRAHRKRYGRICTRMQSARPRQRLAHGQHRHAARRQGGARHAGRRPAALRPRARLLSVQHGGALIGDAVRRVPAAHLRPCDTLLGLRSPHGQCLGT